VEGTDEAITSQVFEKMESSLWFEHSVNLLQTDLEIVNRAQHQGRDDVVEGLVVEGQVLRSRVEEGEPLWSTPIRLASQLGVWFGRYDLGWILKKGKIGTRACAEVQNLTLQRAEQLSPGVFQPPPFEGADQGVVAATVH